MKVKNFSFTNVDDFKRALFVLKAELGSVDPTRLYFQIHSVVLDEQKLQPVYKAIEDMFPGSPWFGNSTSGNIVDCDGAAEISVTATIFEKDSTRFKLFQYDLESAPACDIAKQIVAESKTHPWVKAIEMYHTISAESTTSFCEGMDGLAPEIQMFGAIVCSPDITSSKSCVFSSEGGFNSKGLLILFFGGDEFYVESLKISGWKSIGRHFLVTKAEGSTLYELGGVPAYEIYRKYLGIQNDENFFYNALDFPILYEHNGTSIVRAPAASNPDGSLTMSSDVEVGSVISLSYGEPLTIVDSIQQESEKIKKMNPDVLHIFDCAARKAFWTGQDSTLEIQPFKHIAGSSGFFSHGEFLREKGHLNQHNITLVVAAMREGYGKGLQASAYRKQEIKTSKLPLAARMATFIRETSAEVDELNKQLDAYKRHFNETR